MTTPAFLAKHPAYVRYVREVMSGEFVMPEYERDEQNRVILQVGEQFCRYPSCPASKHCYGTSNLRKHVARHKKDLHVASGVTGRISFVEQEKVRAWYDSLFTSAFGLFILSFSVMAILSSILNKANCNDHGNA